MKHFVYLLVSSNKKKIFSYVGYTNDIKKRVTLHNRGKGAKFTRGKKWKLIYHKEYSSKQRAMQEEYKLKNNYKLRKLIKIKNGF